MTNEQTIDAVMALVNDIEDQALIHACGEGAEPAAERSALLHAITAALAAKDAEIAALKQRLADSGHDLQALKAAPAPGEWVAWEGGECPIAKTSACVVKFSDGEELDTWPAGYWRWTHCVNQDDNIIAYRIIP